MHKWSISTMRLVLNINRTPCQASRRSTRGRGRGRTGAVNSGHRRCENAVVGQ